MSLLRIVLLQAAVTTGLFAQSITIDLDPSKTKIEWTLGDVLHTVHGTFKLKSGHIEADRANGKLSGQVVVDASSGESGSAARDSRMKKHILETNSYPDITFEPLTVQGSVSASPASITVTGWFSIHGNRHQISIPLQVKISGSEVVADGKFVVPYVAWNMKDPSTFILRVSPQVEINVAAVGTVAPPI